MYNWKNRGLIGVGFGICLVFCMVVLAGCKDKEAIARADTAEAALKEAKAQLQTTTNERDGLRTSAATLTKSVDDLKSQLTSMTGLKDQVSTLTKERDAAMKQLSDQVSAITRERDAAVARVAEAQASIEKLTAQLQEQVQKFLSIEEQNKKLQATIDEMKTKLGDEIKLPQIPNL
jgi:chromosome segregation ATPase